ncbi:MAG TPA: hypothetical protein PLN11_01880, partial [Ottowia sp.]|nr:hypothetical protein [Ottowia sp.]
SPVSITTVLSPHWNDFVTLLNMLMFAPYWIAACACSASAGAGFDSEHDAIPEPTATGRWLVE